MATKVSQKDFLSVRGMQGWRRGRSSERHVAFYTGTASLQKPLEVVKTDVITHARHTRGELGPGTSEMVEALIQYISGVLDVPDDQVS